MRPRNSQRNQACMWSVKSGKEGGSWYLQRRASLECQWGSSPNLIGQIAKEWEKVTAEVGERSTLID